MDQQALPRLITAREVSESTGLSLRRIYELSRTGVIPHVRLGRSVRFSATELSSWFQEGGTQRPQVCF